MADLRHDYVRTLNTPLDTLDMDALRGVFAAQSAEGAALIGAETVALRGIRHLHSVDMQFVGQTHLIRVPVDDPAIGRDALRARFDEVYFRRFRVELAGVPANLVNVNTSVIGERAAVDLSTLIDPGERKGTLDKALRTVRSVYFDGGWVQTPIYRRDLLPLDAVIPGPAVIEQMDTTSLIEPGDVARSDAGGNLIVTLG